MSMASCRQSCERLADQRVIGDLQRAGCHVLLAGGQGREDRGHQVVGLHPLDGRRVLLPAAHPQHGQRPVQVPPPPRREHRRGEHRLPDHALHRRRRPGSCGTWSSGKLCCGPSDSKIASSLAAACSSKSNVTQNRLRSASPSARLSRAPNGACPTSCMPPLSSKNRSSTMVSMRGQHARAAASPARQVGRRSCPRRARRSRIRPAARRPRRPPRSRLAAEPAARPRPAEGADLLGQLDRCGPGPRPSQNGTDGGAPWASTTRTMPGSTRRIRHEVRAEQEHVAGHGLDRPVLVHGADQGVVRLGQHPVVAQLRDRPAGGERGDPGAAAAAQPPVHPVPVQVGGPAARGRSGCPRRPARRRRRSPRRTGPANGRGPADQGAAGRPRPSPRPRTRPPPAGPGCPAAPSGTCSASSRPGPHPAQQRGAFHQLVAGRRVQPARPGCRRGCGWTGRPAAGTWRSCAATRSGRPARPGRCRCPAPATRSRPGPAGRRRAAGSPPAAAGPSTGCRGARRPGRRPAARPAGGRPARPSAGCSRTPAWSGGPRTCPAIRSRISAICSADATAPSSSSGSSRARSSSRRWPESTIAQRGEPSGADRSGTRADQQPGDGLDRALGGRQADPLHRLRGQVLQPLQGQRQVRAALVARDRVDLVDDDRADRSQHRPASAPR